jgi:hypothetical protein
MYFEHPLVKDAELNHVTHKGYKQIILEIGVLLTHKDAVR